MQSIDKRISSQIQAFIFYKYSDISKLRKLYDEAKLKNKRQLYCISLYTSIRIQINRFDTFEIEFFKTVGQLAVLICLKL